MANVSFCGLTDRWMDGQTDGPKIVCPPIYQCEGMKELVGQGNKYSFFHNVFYLFSDVLHYLRHFNFLSQSAFNLDESIILLRGKGKNSSTYKKFDFPKDV